MSGKHLYQLDRIKRIVNNGDVILDVDSLDLPLGGLTAIVGPNGAGKSTLLKILAFLDQPDQGNLSFQGEPVGACNFGRLRRRVTMVDQAPLMFSGTVFKNVAYGLRVRGIPSRQWPDRVAEALSLVDLDGFADRLVRGLSGGEAQRVAIARALVFKPQVVLLDEPTAGIDVARKEMVESLITELHAAGDVNVLFSTHSLAQAHCLTDRVIHLSAGKLVAGGLENIFSGLASREGEAGTVRLKSGATLRTLVPPTGPVRFTIPASAVELEIFSDDGGAANRFDGVITRLELRGTMVRLLVSGRLNLRAEMAPEELQRKGLQLGNRVAVVVPPEAIRFL